MQLIFKNTKKLLHSAIEKEKLTAFERGGNQMNSFGNEGDKY
jgi:hypothetical protein